MDKWDLTYLYEDQLKFYDDFDKIIPYVVELSNYAGKLENEEDFVQYFKLEEKVDGILNRIFQYAHLRVDLNKKDVKANQDFQQVYLLYNSIMEATSFEAPEILALGEKKVFKYIDENKEIAPYRFSIEKMFHDNEHILSPDNEKIIAYYDAFSEEGANLYDSLVNADHKDKEVTLSDNTKVKVSQGNWRALIAEAKDANDRKLIFRAIFDYYEQNKYTLANIYKLIYQMELAYCKARNFNSILEMHLFSDDIPSSVYENLVYIASSNSNPLKEYIRVRKKYLNLKEHYTYDRFLELAKSNKKYTYEQAKEMFFASIEKCPEDFKAKAHDALKDGFVDVYEQEGKITGAYSSSQQNLHPYILLNFAGTLDDVFTVAHESGHSIHSLYAIENQPGILQSYTIFVAEIASTFNEHMLLDYLMDNDSLSKDEKIMLLQKEIDEIASTFYRQTLFAQYELEVSRLVENNKPITHDVLSGIMIRLYRKYYGINIEKEEVKKYVWAYIPHLFHTPFYVYQYATSFAASFAFFENVKQGKPNAFENYINLLKSGGSKFPMVQTREAGIDLENKETFKAVTKRMEYLVNKLKELLNVK